jgi:replicative DNA helicase
MSDSALQREYLSAAMYQPRVLEEHPLTPDCFDAPATQAVFDALTALHGSGRPTDPFAVADYLESDGRLSEAGGRRGVADMAESEHGGVIDVESVASELRRGARQRALQDRLLSALHHAQAGRLEEARKAASDALDEGHGEAEIVDAFEAQRAAIDQVAKSRDPIKTGLRHLDDLVGHLDPSDMLMIGADTSVGKTTVALCMAYHLARSGTPVGFVSCEDSIAKLGGKLLGFGAHLDPRNLRLGKVRESDMLRAGEAITSTRGMPLHMAYLPGATEVDVAECMARMRRKPGCRLLVVDYVQTINASRKGHSRRDEIRAIASRLKATAARLDAALVLVSQVTRPPADKRGKPRRPSRHDLKEAGELENMAEFVVILWPGTIEHDVPGVNGSRVKLETEDPNTVHAILDKSKVGGNGSQWTMRRDDFGVLREEEDANAPPPDWHSEAEW